LNNISSSISYSFVFDHIQSYFSFSIIVSAYENIKAKNIYLFCFFSNFILSHFSLNLLIQKSSFRWKLSIFEVKSFYRESISIKSFNVINDFKFNEYRFTSWSLYQIWDLYIKFIHCFLNFMNEIIIVAPSNHHIFSMVALNQIDYIYKSNDNERRNNSQRYLYCHSFIRKIFRLIIFM
jgi:hypothetical protein